jgi:hypothetical protein
MFNKVETTIIKILQDHLQTVPKKNIDTKPDFKRLPAISVSNVNFEIDEVGLGRSIGGVGREATDVFNGDSKNREFTLTEKPLKPILSIEHPIKKRLRESDYFIDYEKGVIVFQTPPSKGDQNVSVKYLKPFDTKGLKLNITYHVNIWAKDENQRDEITVETIKTLLREEDTLTQQGISIKPIKGFNILNGEDIPKGVYGKTLEYEVKTDLHVEIPLPRIEKIEIQQEK